MCLFTAAGDGDGCSQRRDRAGFQEPVTLRIFHGAFLKATHEMPSRETGFLVPDWHSGPFPRGPVARGSDTRCSMTSKPKRICHFCFLVITGFSGGLFFFLLTYVLIVWDFTDHAVFLSALEVFAAESGGSSCPSSSSAGDADR